MGHLRVVDIGENSFVADGTIDGVRLRANVIFNDYKVSVIHLTADNGDARIIMDIVPLDYIKDGVKYATLNHSPLYHQPFFVVPSANIFRDGEKIRWDRETCLTASYGSSIPGFEREVLLFHKITTMTPADLFTLLIENTTFSIRNGLIQYFSGYPSSGWKSSITIQSIEYRHKVFVKLLYGPFDMMFTAFSLEEPVRYALDLIVDPFNTLLNTPKDRISTFAYKRDDKFITNFRRALKDGGDVYAAMRAHMLFNPPLTIVDPRTITLDVSDSDHLRISQEGPSEYSLIRTKDGETRQFIEEAKLPLPLRNRATRSMYDSRTNIEMFSNYNTTYGGCYNDVVYQVSVGYDSVVMLDLLLPNGCFVEITMNRNYTKLQRFQVTIMATEGIHCHYLSGIHTEKQDLELMISLLQGRFDGLELEKADPLINEILHMTKEELDLGLAVV
ncbi:MAG: hypothetical protein D6698_16410 [Gammaproteobacteria bacterium]|nr:MAG: hypothetical protein D6698_16410 [Gammaproteobacteria bacterium]